MPTPRIALTGRPGSGKTTAAVRTIRRLEEAGTSCAGFYTLEVRGQGRRVGFDLVLVGPRGGRVPLARVGLDSPLRVSRYGVDVDAVRRVAVPALEASADVIVVDEVASMELAAPDFCGAVDRLLHRDQPVLLTVHARRHPYTDELKARPDLEVFEITRENRDDLPERLADLLRR